MTRDPHALFPRAARVAAVAVLSIFAVPVAGLGAGHMPHETMAPAAKAAKGGITIARPWARASAGRARNGAAYFTILNKGAHGDRLTGAETPVAKDAQLHEHRMTDGIMRMRRIKGGLAIPPGGSLAFAPRGYHVMLMGLGKPLKAGGGFPLTLIFERAGRITVTVAVHAIGAAPMPMHRH